MIDKTEIVTDCHEVEVGITAGMWEAFNPQNGRGRRSKAPAASSSAASGCVLNVRAHGERDIRVAVRS